MPPMPDAAGLQAEGLCKAEDLERIRPEWAALWDRLDTASPFQSPDWLIPWWRHVGKGDLLAIALRDGGGRLVGLVPLYIYRQPQDGQRIVFPLGMGTTDHLDALIAPAWREAAMAAVFRRLAAQRDHWDRCEWPQLRPDSALLQAAPPEGWAEERAEAEPCLTLRLPRSVEALREVVPKRMLQNLRTYRRKAERDGKLRWERAEERSLDRLFDAQLRLHQARWAARGEAGVLASEQVQAAHRDALPGLLRSGLLRLYALHLGAEIVATLYGLIDRPGAKERRFYYYLGGFAPEFAALSPGTLVIGHAIEEAIREGVAVFDFLRGREGYKFLWGARETPTFCRRITPAPQPMHTAEALPVEAAPR